MHSIISHSIPLRDVIGDLAKQLNVSVQHNCDEYTLIIPPIFGEGTIKGLDFKDGLGIILYDCNFKNDLEIRFIVDRVHPLKFLFCELGSLTHRFENDNEMHHLGLLENMIVASSQYNGHILKFSAGERTVVNSLEINRAKFIINNDCTLKSLEKNLEFLFRDTKATAVFYHHGNYSVRMADLFMEIDGFPEEDFLRYLFLEGSAFKILTLQILQYLDDIALPEHKAVLRKFEMKLVREAAAYIDNEILDFKSVMELSNMVGLNPNKLQNGFKKLYQNTVNGYVYDRRLDVANGLLKNSEYTISEIVYMVGLSSKSYFSKIFKDKYGISPSLTRENGNRRNKST